jgi:hypothetical protein
MDTPIKGVSKTRMKRFAILILIALCIAASPAGAGTTTLLCGGAKGSASSCNPANDEVGDKTEHAENYDIANGRILCFLYTPDCYGTLGYAYSMHEGTGSDTGYVCVYKDDGDSSPDTDSGDTLVACSAELSSNDDDTWVQSSGKLSGSLTSGNYWVCTIGSSGSWKVRWDATGTRTVYLADGFNYGSPPANFGAVDFSSTAGRDIATYVAIE